MSYLSKRYGNDGWHTCVFCVEIDLRGLTSGWILPLDPLMVVWL